MKSSNRLGSVLISFFLIASASAQVYQGKMYEGPSLTSGVVILASVTVKKNEGCTQATKNTKFPLTEEQCMVLFEKWGRHPVPISSPLMMPIVTSPVMYPGDQLHYVFTATGNGWVLQPM